MLKEYHFNVDYIDCNKISTLITSLDILEIAIGYLKERLTLNNKLKPSLMILDNINALCPFISNDEQFNMIEAVKTEKITKMINRYAE